MRKKREVKLAGAGLAAAAVFGASTVAQAQTTCTAPLCSSYNGGNVVYFDGSTAVQPVLQTLAKNFAAATPAINIGIVYQSVGSCQGNIDLLTPVLQKQSPVYLDPVSGKATACCLADPVNGQAPDIAVSDVFPAICTATNNAPAVGTGFKEFVGPIQVMTMVTRKESKENSISADAAYTIFGFAGSQYQVMPWIDPTMMFIRKPTSGTINMIGTAINLPAAKWLAGYMGLATQQQSGSGALLAALQNASNADASIGILAADLADQYRNPAALADGGAPPPAIKILAYKHTGQSCGYYPDSDAAHFDKINVRQGRYAIWGPVHMITAVDATTKVPKNANVNTILQYFASVGPSPDATLTTAQKQAMIDAEAKAYTVPWCAMQVQRATEIGLPTSFQPAEPCGCYYESQKGAPSAGCTACTPANEATVCTGSTPKCRYGFCEAM
jgi:ABC-type phosphate transport system substrate-binding protein